jgi:acyl-CoA synthetase (AMP-forming)/AMP-acid ligase II
LSLAAAIPEDILQKEESYSNVYDYLLSGKDPEKIALILPDGEKTYGDILFSSQVIASYLLQQGYSKGDRILLIGENSFFWVASYLGILRAGLVCVPLPANAPEETVSYIAQVTEAKLACVPARVFLKNKLRLDIPVLTDLPARAPDNPEPGPSIDETAVISRGHEFPQISRDDLAALMFTSGTTGKPRGVMVSHGNIIANTNSIIQYLRLSADDRIMTVLPFHYCFGASLLHTHLRVGGSLVIDPRFMFPEKILERLRETECTGFAGVPSHYQILLRKSSLRQHSFPHLRYVQQAGGHLATAFVRELREALPGTEIFVMYGQTEATARLSYMPPEMLDKKPGSIGKGIPGVKLRVLCEGRDAAPGEVGEIVAEGENITQGYWRAEEETAAVFHDGGLYTGDLATMDEDGYIFIVDRAKDFIKCGGNRVSCRQIEEKLLEFDGLLEAAVIGVPDEVLGEAVKAFVVSRQAEESSLEDILREFCKRNFLPALVPKEFVFLDALPKNASGKVAKFALREIKMAS